MIATVIAIAGTIPVLATQIWLFVKPALKPIERKVITFLYSGTFSLISCRSVLLVILLFFRPVMNFLVELGGDMVATNFTAEKYFRFIFNMTIPFGVLFELPVVLMFLTSLGIINPYRIAKNSKICLFHSHFSSYCYITARFYV